MHTTNHGRRISRRRTKAESTPAFQKYVATATAAAAAFGGASVADAEIISKGLSQSIPRGAPYALNLTATASGGASVATFNFQGGNGDPGYDYAELFFSNLNLASVVMQKSNSRIAALAPDTLILGSFANESPYKWHTPSGSNPNVSFNGGLLNGVMYSTSVGNFNGGSDKYIGIRFRSDSSASYRYGWIQYEGGNLVGSGTIKGWGYDDAGNSILAGEAAVAPVPEPTGLALLAAGTLAGTAAAMAKRWRKRKAAA